MALNWLAITMNAISSIVFFIVSPILVNYCIILFKTTSIKSAFGSETITESSLITRNKTTYNASKCAIILFTISCISYSLMFIVWFIQYFMTETLRPALITIWDAFSLLMYISGIWLMLFTFLLRIHYAFNDSFLAYPKWLIISLYAFIFLIAITMLLIVVSYAITHHMLMWLAPLCVAELVLYDVILLYLLFRKLFRIFVMRGVQNTNNNDIQSENVHAPPVIELDTLETTTIYSTLILLSIISTLMFATLIALKASAALALPSGSFIALDIYVNGTCLFLMFAVNKERYNKCCSKYHACLQSCCINCAYKGDITSKTTKEQYASLVLAETNFLAFLIMGTCVSNSSPLQDISSFSCNDPSQWSQQEIISWLKHNPNLSPLIKPFKKHKIAGLAFASLSQEDMKNELQIMEFGLIKEFILSRNKLIHDYQRRKLDTFSTTNSHSNPKSYTEEESGQKIPLSLRNQIQSNTKTRDSFQKQLRAIDDERETSPLLTTIDVLNDKHSDKKSNYKHIDEEQYDAYDEYDDFIHDDDEYHEVVITDDDGYVISGETNATLASNIDLESESATTTNTANTNTTCTSCHNSHQRMLAAYNHGWKVQNIACNACVIGSNEFVTVNDLKWIKIRHDRDSLDVLGINNERNRNKERIYDYSFMKQYADVSYNGGCKLVIDGCIHALCLLVYHEYEYIKYSGEQIHDISEVIFKYLYEKEKSVYQFAFDIWKILYKINRKEIVDTQEIKSFIGDSLVIEMRKKYWNKYRFEDICLYCNDLLACNYIELIARREGSKKLSNANVSQLFMNDSKYLYTFLKVKKREFKKYHNFIHNMLDRDSWCRGTQVEIFSISLSGWKLGEIVKIGASHDTIVVSYNGGTDSKYLLKTVKRYDINLVRSTREYIVMRNNWKIGTEIEIFSHSDDSWYKAVIEGIIARDTDNDVIDSFHVKYCKEIESVKCYYTKCVDQWSSNCRDIQIITNEKLKKYKYAKKCKVWFEDHKSWNVCYIKDIIPIHQYVVVQNKQHHDAMERIIDINSGFIRPV